MICSLLFACSLDLGFAFPALVFHFGDTLFEFCAVSRAAAASARAFILVALLVVDAPDETLLRLD